MLWVMRTVPLFATGLLFAWLMPGFLWQILVASLASGALFLAVRHTTFFCMGWLLIAGCSLEMTLSDLVGPEVFQPAIAVIKAAEMGLAVIAALRWGVRGDPWNPAWAFAIVAVVGFAHGLYPGLTMADSARSLIGSVAPFAFCFIRAPARWADASIRAIRWCAVVAVAGGVVLALAGVRPLFVDSGGMRLTGLGHPAFLATVCMASVYATLIWFYRTGDPAELLLLAVNLLLLLLTGARAPLFFGVMVSGVTLGWVSAPHVSLRWRVFALLGAGATIPVLIAFMLAGGLGEVRIFNLLSSDATHLSGRETLWAAFEEAIQGSPWVGWGIGAGNAIIPPDGPIAQLLRTWAAHNEYLRLQVEGGRLGLGLLIVMFCVWVWQRTRLLPTAERRIMRLVFLAFAGHAFTDNLLISTPACVLLTLAAAVFAHAESPLPDAVPRA